MKDSPHAQSPYKRSTSLQASTSYMGSAMCYYVEKKDAGGNLGFVEYLAKPGNEPPPKMHADEDQCFYVLDGKVEFFVGNEQFTVLAGECAIVPRGMPHAFIIRSARLRTLIMFSPGGCEGYFRAISSPALSLDLPQAEIIRSTLDIEDALRLGPKFGIRFLSKAEIAEDLPTFTGFPLPSAAFEEVPLRFKAL